MTVRGITRGTKATIHLLLHEPFSIKLAHLWVNSLLPGHNALKDKVQWITFKAKAWMESYLKPDMFVFEYGSGGSTLFLSRRVNKLISIEHNKSWYRKVSIVLSKENISNCEYILCEPEEEISTYKSELRKYTGMNFEKYVKSIDKYPSGSFDLVIVDGRARVSCILHAISKIRLGGYLMLDNSERERYSDAISFLADYKRTDFFGIGPYSTYLWQTSLFERKRKED